MVERVVSKRRRRVMKDFQISELSAVDKPAQAPALAVLMKRADGDGDTVLEKKYKSVSELPPAVKDNLPSRAQHQFMAVANSVLSGGGSDASAFQQAWGALRNAGWSKDKSGKWVKKSDEEVAAEIDAAVLGKASQTDAGTKFPASDFAFVPDKNKPSTWKLRLTASPGGAPDPRFVGAAAAALSPGGHRGKKVQLPSDAVAGVKAKVRAAWRKANPDKDASAMPDSIKKDYGDSDDAPQAAPMLVADVNDDVQATDFATVLAENEAREAAEEVGDELREKWCALQQAFRSIAEDDTISAQDKITAMQASMQQYIDSLSEQSQEIADSMTKALTTAVPAVAELLAKDGTSEGDEPMTDAEKKQLAKLQKDVEELTNKLAAATEENDDKAVKALQKSLDEANAKVAELEKSDAVAKDSDEYRELVAKAGMTDAEKQYMAGLSGKAKMDFMSASSADRAKMMSKAVDDDPVVYKAADGTEFRKSDDPRLAKMAERNDELAKQAAEEIEKREVAEFEKKADDEPYKFYKGTTEQRGKVLRAVSKIDDEEARKALTDMLETGGKMIAKAFDTVGHRSEEAQKSATDFLKKVDEIVAKDKITKSKAMQKAARLYPDEFAAYQGADKN